MVRVLGPVSRRLASTGLAAAFMQTSIARTSQTSQTVYVSLASRDTYACRHVGAYVPRDTYAYRHPGASARLPVAPRPCPMSARPAPAEVRRLGD